jgi:hypothetical protein
MKLSTLVSGKAGTVVTAGNTGQDGVTVSATQYVYVKQFENGQPT